LFFTNLRQNPEKWNWDLRNYLILALEHITECYVLYLTFGEPQLAERIDINDGPYAGMLLRRIRKKTEIVSFLPLRFFSFTMPD